VQQGSRRTLQTLFTQTETSRIKNRFNFPKIFFFILYSVNNSYTALKEFAGQTFLTDLLLTLFAFRNTRLDNQSLCYNCVTYLNVRFNVTFREHCKKVLMWAEYEAALRE